MQMATINTRQDNSTPFMQIRYVKCTEKIPGLLVAITGLLTSIWTNCAMVTICVRSIYYSDHADMFVQNNIVYTSQLTHLIIIFTCTAGLIVGLKEKNRSYISLWMIVKIIEIISSFVACIFLPTGRYGIFVMVVGIFFTLVAGYITVCVWKTYEKMSDNSSSLDDDCLTVPDELPLPIDPPSYDSFLNHATLRI